LNPLFPGEAKGSGSDFIFIESISRTGQARRGNTRSVIRRSGCHVYTYLLAYAYIKIKSVTLPFVWAKATKQLQEKRNVFCKSKMLAVKAIYPAIYMQGFFLHTGANALLGVSY
jgi:hypothetical protein